MKLATFPEVYEDAVRRLVRALGELAEGQLRVARANARREVRRSLEALRRKLDDAHPGVPKAPKVRSGPRPALKRILRLKDAGWLILNNEVDRHELLKIFAETGVRVRRVAYGEGILLAPRWAVLAARSGAMKARKVSEAKRSLKVRRALLAAHALGATTP